MNYSPFIGWKPETLLAGRDLLREAAKLEAGTITAGKAITVALEENHAGAKNRSKLERIARLALKRTREPRTCSKAADLITRDLKSRGLKVR